MEHEDRPPKDASLDAWKELSGLLNDACAESGGALAVLQEENFGLLIQEKQPPRALKVEYSPELKKLRYNTAASGWQELTASEGRRTVVFDTPCHREYTVKQLSELVLEELRRSPF